MALFVISFPILNIPVSPHFFLKPFSILASATESTNIIPLVLAEPQPSSSSIADSTATTILHSTYSPISTSFDSKVNFFFSNAFQN